ncbi:MAG: class I SAM-dependent methyltransferase, partial [Dehalococcoidales bacterium]|nr:class I SAM-dependent methyltransferase [Dehalococcoidales bacterium]
MDNAANQAQKNMDIKAQSGFLHRIFTAIPSRYDIINHLMTGGMDILWRKKAARECLALKPRKVLDICCGTGDLTLAVSKLAGKNTRITGLDYSRSMLDVATHKAEKADYKISFVAGDLAAIPFPRESFDSLC